MEEAVRRTAPIGDSGVAIAASRKQQVEAARGGPDPRSPHSAGDCPKKALKPRARCTLAEWAQTTYRLSQRRAARLIPVRLNTWRYRLPRDPQDALRQRLRELAAVHVRFRYRRLTVLLRREGWRVNAKGIYRLYRLEGLEVRTKPRKKLASRARVPLPRPSRPNERWNMDFLRARLADWRWFSDTDGARSLQSRIVSARGRSVAHGRQSRSGTQRCAGTASSATGDHGRQGRRVRQPRDGRVGVRARCVLDFIRPGKPVEMRADR
ncbi:MAG: hypothetical protein DMF89_18125 [Acidobacteria bacterium]|nr:MAG: hypothetical protein DMF89_18125 [Acidobacteriota bacterium]